MKGAGKLVVSESLRVVNFGFWSHLVFSGQNAIICPYVAVKVSLGLHAKKYKIYI